jgi:hypothetical protein
MHVFSWPVGEVPGIFLKFGTVRLYGSEFYLKEIMMFIITNHCTIGLKSLFMYSTHKISWIQNDTTTSLLKSLPIAYAFK